MCYTVYKPPFRVGGFGSLVSGCGRFDARGLFFWFYGSMLQNHIVLDVGCKTMWASGAFIMAFVVSVNMDLLTIRANDINMK